MYLLRFVFLLVSFSITNVYCLEDIPSGGGGNLFIDDDNIHEIYGLKSITYIRLVKSSDDHSPEADEETLRVFKEFSELIGREHGGVIIDESASFDKVIKITRNSNCPFSSIEHTEVIFEDFESKKCFNFKYKNNADLNQILSEIFIRLDDKDKIEELELRKDLYEIINEYAPKETSKQVKKFVDFVISEMLKI